MIHSKQHRGCRIQDLGPVASIRLKPNIPGLWSAEFRILGPVTTGGTQPTFRTTRAQRTVRPPKRFYDHLSLSVFLNGCCLQAPYLLLVVLVIDHTMAVAPEAVEMEVQHGRCTWYPGDICFWCQRPKKNNKCLRAGVEMFPKGCRLGKKREVTSDMVRAQMTTWEEDRWMEFRGKWDAAGRGSSSKKKEKKVPVSCCAVVPCPPRLGSAWTHPAGQGRGCTGAARTADGGSLPDLKHRRVTSCRWDAGDDDHRWIMATLTYPKGPY